MSYMYHLESSFKGKNAIWRYVIMFAAVLVVSNTIGALPLGIAFFLKAQADPGVIGELASNPNDLSVLGLNPNMGFFVMLFPFMAGLLAFVLLMKPLHGRLFITVINGGRKIRWDRFFISAGVWLMLSGLYLFIYLKADPGNFRLNNTSMTLLVLAVISVLFVPFQAAFEEVLFRGYLMQGFGILVKNRWFPLVMTALLFGLMHSFNPEVKDFGFLAMMPQYILFGLIFGIITILDDGIEAAMGAHAANNIFLCIMVTHKSSALQTAALYEQQNVLPWIELAALLITGVIFLLVLKRLFGWNDISVLAGRVAEPPEEIQMS